MIPLEIESHDSVARGCVMDNEFPWFYVRQNRTEEWKRRERERAAKRESSKKRKEPRGMGDGGKESAEVDHTHTRLVRRAQTRAHNRQANVTEADRVHIVMPKYPSCIIVQSAKAAVRCASASMLPGTERLVRPWHVPPLSPS